MIKLKKSEQEICKQVSLITILGNIGLSIFKMIAGIYGKSQAMISDSVHSLSDVFSTIIVFVGIKISHHQADAKHPYGHERFENVASNILAVSLLIIGVFIGYKGILSIIHHEVLPLPKNIGIVAAIISIIVKEMMYHYTKFYANQIQSNAMLADAWHHRSDALSSIGSLLGILGSKFGFSFFDPLASILIAICIIKIALEIYFDSFYKMLDTSVNQKTLEKMKNSIEKTDGVLSLDDIKTRLFGNRVYVDIEIGVDATLSIENAHQISHQVHDSLEQQFKEIKHCMVHVNPKRKENR